MFEKSDQNQNKQKIQSIKNEDEDSSLVILIEDSTLIKINCPYEFWTKTLGSARHILAPMVDQSELAFRLLVRQYNIHCTYSPMFNSGIFVKDIKYQRDCLQVLPELDKPLIIQFCANKPEIFLKAAKIAEPYCDAIDLNLGCPQTIARRGHYGAFLQDEWSLIYEIVNVAARNLSKPITCKIRIFKEVEKTIKYAKMIESAGASLITVHGRLREQKGPLTGLADWSQIRAVKENVKIPVFANGNIQAKIEVEKCFQETNVDGVMSAEGLLYNPALFTNKMLTVWDATCQYVQLTRRHPCPFSYIRGHVFKFFHHCFMLEEHQELRNVVSKTRSDEDFLKVAEKLKERYHDEYETFISNGQIPSHPKDFPVFFCKPYFRPPPTVFNSKPKNLLDVYNQFLGAELICEVKKPTKRIKIGNNTKWLAKSRRVSLELCIQCPNPKGIKCDFGFCRTCCRNKTFLEKLHCSGHRFRVKLKTQNNDNI